MEVNIEVSTVVIYNVLYSVKNDYTQEAEWHNQLPRAKTDHRNKPTENSDAEISQSNH